MSYLWGKANEPDYSWLSVVCNLNPNFKILKYIMIAIFLKKVSGYLQYLIIGSLCLCFVGCNQKSEKELSFAFMGDLHYSLNHIEKTDSLVQAVAGELNNLERKPEFLIQTGDFFHGSSGVSIESEAEMAFSHFTRDIGMPYFIAKGNHDSRTQYEKNALPLFSKELGVKVAKSYYSFDKGNSHFVMLDAGEKNLPEMLSWLEKDLQTARANPKTDHIFAAAHDPLWIVARAGFTSREYAGKVGPLLAKYKIDAYFCGHTHNKTVTVRLIDNQPVTQIMDAAVVEKGRLFMLAPFMNHVYAKPSDDASPDILPLDEGHQIFIPKSQLQYYWGYQEGSMSSYYIITIKGKSIQADWYVLGSGLVRSFKWDEPGKLTDLKSPEKIQKNPITENDLQQISKAWLYAAPWILKDSVAAPFTINGVPAGTVKINRVKMAASPFWNKIEIPLNESAMKSIRMINEINISNPSGGQFGLAHVFLLVQLKNGRFARTNIARKVLTSFDPAGGDYYNFPAAELIASVKSGDPLQKVVLNFEFFY
jgi:hypothetical protein